MGMPVVVFTLFFKRFGQTVLGDQFVVFLSSFACERWTSDSSISVLTEMNNSVSVFGERFFIFFKCPSFVHFFSSLRMTPTTSQLMEIHTDV